MLRHAGLVARTDPSSRLVCRECSRNQQRDECGARLANKLQPQSRRICAWPNGCRSHARCALHGLDRHGDANMRSAWICTRDDVLGNAAVLLAALGVFGTGTERPDLIVAALMGALAIQGAATVAKQALAELRQPLSLPAKQ